MQNDVTNHKNVLSSAIICGLLTFFSLLLKKYNNIYDELFVI